MQRFESHQTMQLQRTHHTVPMLISDGDMNSSLSCPFHSSFGNLFGMPKISWYLPKLILLYEKHYWVHRCPTMCSRMSRCFYDGLWRSYNHFRPLGEYESCLIMCPLGINFGTVWRLYTPQLSRTQRWSHTNPASYTYLPSSLALIPP